MVFVEGTKVKGKRIPEKQIMNAWKTISRKPLPKVKALRLTDEEFYRAIQNRQCFEDDLREVEEWGNVLSIEGTDGCVFNTKNTHNAEYVILVRENPYHDLDEIIVHELSHIARGDL